MNYCCWSDIGRRVEIEIDGRKLFGVLNCYDSYYDADNEEIPLFNVILDNDEEASFGSIQRWRFVT